ncbi:hypothetical protein AAMO2058_001729500 [Amorphochlora amoebiformis]
MEPPSISVMAPPVTPGSLTRKNAQRKIDVPVSMSRISSVGGSSISRVPMYSRKPSNSMSLSYTRNSDGSPLMLSVSGIERAGVLAEDEKDRDTLNNMIIVDHSGALNFHKDIVQIKHLGEGVSSSVYLGLYVSTLHLVAVKEQFVAEKADETRLMAELRAIHRNLVPLTECQNCYRTVGGVHPCPYIVAFYGAWSDRTRLTVSFVMEYMDGGSLESIVENKRPITSEVVLQRILFCCLKGLSHLHKHLTVHRDLKPANLLVSHTGMVKIADLGLAKQAQTKGEKFMDKNGTVAYFSPERINGEPYSFAADVWGLGASILAICIGEDPFDAENKIFGLREQIISCDVDKILAKNTKSKQGLDFKESKTFSENFRSLLSNMLHQDQTKRSKALRLLARDFFTKQAPGVPRGSSNGRLDRVPSDPVTGKQENLKSRLRGEWEKAFGYPDGKDIMTRIRKVVTTNAAASHWLFSSIQKFKSRSTRNLMSSEEMLRKTEPRQSTTMESIPSMIQIEKGYRASMLAFERQALKKDMKSSDGTKMQQSLWEAFENLAIAVGLPRTEVMKELKELEKLVPKGKLKKKSELKPINPYVFEENE